MDRNLTAAIELMAVPGEATKEAVIAAELRRRLAVLGVPASCIVDDGAHGRIGGGEAGNLIVRLDGRGRGERRMLTTHMDTVPGAVGSKPRLDGERVRNDAPGKALGADARAGCACLLGAIEALMAKRGDHPPRTFVFFVQEEIGLVGSKHLDAKLLGEPFPAMAFNFDGGDAEEIANAVIGTERLHIDLTGVAVHTSRAQLGISCAVILAEALAELERDGWVGEVKRDGGWATSNLGILRGGTGSNVVMPELYALAEVRSFDLGFRAKVLEAWRTAFRAAVERANAKAAGRNVTGHAAVAFRPGPEYPPYTLPEDAPVVLAARRAIEALGRTPRLFKHAGGMDSCNIVVKGIPAVGLGMGDRGAHSVDEWLDVPHFLDACKLAVSLATGE
ncbi:MAG TPA: M20/M25/M40 family metallo-hydrolase [Planctomycetota bacterium]|nr:M20/M25/M40 family metallo-hydrolase [Planctomycetota bacterium]